MGTVWGGHQWEGEGQKRRQIWFIPMNENQTMKPVETVLRRGEWGRGIGVNLIEVHCMFVWKYHNETPLYN
jgi:hypothetical protein